MARIKARDWNLVRNILAGARTFETDQPKGGDTNILKEYQEEIEEALTVSGTPTQPKEK